MEIPNNPNNPDDWFLLAEHFVNDDNIFSKDQIAVLRAAIEAIRNGVGVSIRLHTHNDPHTRY